MPVSAEVTDAVRSLGYPGLRPLQEQVIGPLMEGRDVLAILPTSSGKSLCFQVPAVVRPGPVVVISPLVALMDDQVKRCLDAGLRAHALHSHCSVTARRRIAEGATRGEVQILYISPERLQGMDRSFFGDHPPQLFAIDEAHCISEWGHDFRPAYQRVGKNLKRFGQVQKLVLTATATPDVAEEIGRVAGVGADCERLVRSPDRPNIRYAMAGEKVPVTRMMQFVELPVLVYGGTRRIVEEAARELRSAGYRAAHYHAGMEKGERTSVQTKFRDGEYDVVCATCAFGMGIDHPGIRAVLHLEMPTSLEAYVQESGRAGRDGRQSVAICKATVETLETSLHLSLMTWPDPRTVLAFHRRLTALFDQKASRWEGPDRLQKTCEELGTATETHPIEVGSCLRILDEYGVVRRTPYQERPVRVVLLKNSTVRVKTEKQRDVIERLASEADSLGVVEGTVSFFSDQVGMDRGMAERLSLSGALRYEWVDRCQVIERGEGRADDVDADRLLAMRARSVRRIQACREFVACRTCRRKFLLEWFGASQEDPPLGVCCDRCRR